MIIMPPLSERQKRDPPEIAGVILQGIGLVTPLVRRGIHEPGHVINKNGPEKEPPN